MGKARKVIFWGKEDLLGRSVEIFLSACDDWEVVRLSSKQRNEEFMEVIEQEKPDVVLLYQDCEINNETLPMQLIHSYPGMKVISLNLDSNEIETFDRQKLCIKSIADLLSAIEG